MIIDFDEFHSYEGSSAFTCPKCEKKVRYHIDCYNDCEGVDNKGNCIRCGFEFKVNMKIEVIDDRDIDIETVTIDRDLMEDSILSSHIDDEDVVMWLHEVDGKLEYCPYDIRTTLPFVPITVHEVVEDLEIEENTGFVDGEFETDAEIINYTVKDTVKIDNEKYNLEVIDK